MGTVYRLRRQIPLAIFRGLLRLFTRCEIHGRENIPTSGPLIIAFNHLGHLDGPLVISAMPFNVEAIALSDLYRVPVTGQLLRLYGVIPVHRDAFDREVLRRALEVLGNGGVLTLAPEARQSPTGALVKARDGVAYLAMRSRARVLPVALTGTEKVYSEWKQLRRPRLTLTIGEPFSLPQLTGVGTERRRQLSEATDMVMRRIAALLPPEYRGVYG
ncbi:MAG: 1-acyl-sn-glycerol-3-phosphate acyltransferase [Chloroflexi bacterium]|nr:1-acyl-sn-glycerol-3-phosphate acyltransferase [Chloroflexota bacterium]